MPEPQRRMFPNPAHRASDEERERTAKRLRSHYAAGRLSSVELEHRIERAYRARTRGELWALSWDLPRVPSRRGAMTRLAQLNRRALRWHAAVYGSVNGSLISIWALTGEGHFWPAWALVPGTALLGWHVLGTRRLGRALSRPGSGRNSRRQLSR